MKLRLTTQTGIGISNRMMATEFAFVALLLISFWIDIPLLVLATFALGCCLVLFSSLEKSMYYLAFFTSFSCTFVYDGKHMFFVMVALFIIRYLFTQRLNRKTVLFYLLIIVYSLLFLDINDDLNFSRLIGPILLFAIPIVADASGRIDCKQFIHHYIFGFVLTTVIGFFVSEIPALLELFYYDLWWTEGGKELTRFFGLAFDCNFYALSNYLVLAYLLFTSEKITKGRLALVLFLIFGGLQTLSKSYLLMLVFLAAIYILKQRKNAKRLLITFATAGIATGLFIAVSGAMGYNVVELTLSRFNSGSFADNTTGRFDIWGVYFDYFYHSGVKKLLFGTGFNAVATSAAHNTFIEMFFLYGIVGSGIWIGYFIHCWELFSSNTKNYTEKSPFVMISLCFGIFFLSAYTYESLWIGIVIAFMTLPYVQRKRKRWLSI